MGVGWALLFAFALGVWPLLGGAANLSPGRSLGLPGAGLISGRAGGSESPGGKGGGGVMARVLSLCRAAARRCKTRSFAKGAGGEAVCT